MSNERIRGEVKWFSAVKGYGFVTHNEEEIFVHYSAINSDGFRTLKEGQEVEFEIVETEKGPQCADVEIIG